MNIEILQKLIDRKAPSARAASLDCGFQPNTLGYFLKGARKPTIEQLMKLSEYFAVSVDYLLGLSDKANSSLYVDAYKQALELCQYAEERLGSFENWDQRNTFINETIKFLIDDSSSSGAQILQFVEKEYKRVSKAA